MTYCSVNKHNREAGLNQRITQIHQEWRVRSERAVKHKAGKKQLFSQAIKSVCVLCSNYNSEETTDAATELSLSAGWHLAVGSG